MKHPSDANGELTSLRALSSRLGGNPLLVQASTGNTSIKIDDSLWIKASGKWLINSEADDFLVHVELGRARCCLRRNTPIPETQASSSMRVSASIETAMHVVLPQRVVVHVHSVNAIAWAVRADGAKQLSAQLAGLRWEWIPYTPSGTALAYEIERAASAACPPDVLVLGNHGLVICGDSCESALRLLGEVENRLAIEPRPAPMFCLDQIGSSLPGPGWFAPPWAEVHALATDPMSRQILAGGVLYPCQAIFLPETVPGLSPDRQAADGELASRAAALHLSPNIGVACSERMSVAEQQILFGLANVVRRIDATAPIRYLSDSEIQDVVGGNVDAYRGSANANYNLSTGESWGRMTFGQGTTQIA